jgi:hypothetical protein
MCSAQRGAVRSSQREPTQPAQTAGFPWYSGLRARPGAPHKSNRGLAGVVGLVGRSTGRSWGEAPLKMRSMYVAVRW